MAIIYPPGRPGRGGRFQYYPGGDGDDCPNYGEMGPMGYGGPPPWYPGRDFYPRRDRDHGQYDWPMSPYLGHGGHHNIYQCWPPWPPREEKKDKDKDKDKKGPSNKKAFLLVRQKPKASKKDDGWKGYCEHMPAKTHSAQAADWFYYMFT